MAVDTPDGAGTVSCAALKATYIPGVACSGDDSLFCGDLAILLPCNCTEFRALYRASSGRATSVTVREPCVCVIPPDRQIELRYPRPADLLVIHVDPLHLENRIREETGRRATAIAPRYCAFDPLLRELGNALQSELRRRTIPSRTRLEALADIIAIHLGYHYEAAAGGALSAGLSQVRLNKVRSYIESHLGETLAVSDLAEAVHMSPFHFARMFKKATGESPHSYVTAQRVQKAKELLRESSLPLTEVAVRVGFQTHGHFTSVFHRYTGITPRAFRRKHQAV
jgi:AraC-like DNA-binding protein